MANSAVLPTSKGIKVIGYFLEAIFRTWTGHEANGELSLWGYWVASDDLWSLPGVQASPA